MYETPQLPAKFIATYAAYHLNMLLTLAKSPEVHEVRKRAREDAEDSSLAAEMGVSCQLLASHGQAGCGASKPRAGTASSSKIATAPSSVLKSKATPKKLASQKNDVHVPKEEDVIETLDDESEPEPEPEAVSEPDFVSD
ncbi:hypothetical protein AURDEDRAFT_159194 [Auricularia subglabra TFB-10046 SS5]|nr:hypothetical protein AURDEDRAFT_159194 [Auricularia subglabra TFB-10046 SS5]